MSFEFDFVYCTTMCYELMAYWTENKKRERERKRSIIESKNINSNQPTSLFREYKQKWNQQQHPSNSFCLSVVERMVYGKWLNDCCVFRYHMFISLVHLLFCSFHSHALHYILQSINVSIRCIRDECHVCDDVGRIYDYIKKHEIPSTKIYRREKQE